MPAREEKSKKERWIDLGGGKLVPGKLFPHINGRGRKN